VWSSITRLQNLQKLIFLSVFKILPIVIFSNYRYAAYRQYIWWVFGRLGRKKRKIIPACVVLAIQKQFPEADGSYTGFKDPSITELDLAFFE